MVRDLLLTTVLGTQLLLGGCASDPGTLGGECYGNGTCNEGLTCESGLCKADTEPSDLSLIHI